MKTLLVVVAVLVAICVHAGEATGDKRLIAALITVESHGNDRAIGDVQKREKAYGCLQIRKPCVDDVNKRCGTNYRAEDMLGNRSLSVWLCKSYISLYATKDRLGREPTLEDMARIWNGGPNGWRSKNTNAYWAKVRRQLQ